MNYNSKIHSLSHVIKSIIGKIEKNLYGFNYPDNELIVVNYHSTPKKFDKEFEKQLLFLKKHFNIIDPGQLHKFYFDPQKINTKCSLLFTFDDGLKNNLNALAILEKHNIKAFLFVVPEFINTNIKDQKDYYLKNIRPIINSNVDSNEEDFVALDWQELRSIIKWGHLIGSHTLTHTLIAEKSDLENSKREIIDSKKIIEKELQIEVTSFCSINNTAVSVDKKEKEIIDKEYTFHFTTFPGLNSQQKDSLLIKRRNIESFWMIGAIYYAIGKFDLSRWQDKITSYKNL